MTSVSRAAEENAAKLRQTAALGIEKRIMLEGMRADFCAVDKLSQRLVEHARQVDRITGSAITSALLWTRNSSHSGEAYAQPAQLFWNTGSRARCFEPVTAARAWTKAGPEPAVLQSLNMLVCTEGKERTLAEYAELLRRVGFADVEGRRTDAPVDAVLGVKR